jgi:hypothetical protein
VAQNVIKRMLKTQTDPNSTAMREIMQELAERVLRDAPTPNDNSVGERKTFDREATKPITRE